MGFVLRPTHPGDTPQLAALFKDSLGMQSGSPGLQPEVMSWKYWQRRDDWTEPRSYVLEDGAKIVSHAAIWPLTFGSGTTAIKGIQMIDWVAASQSPGAGLALVRRFAGMFDFIYSIGGSESTRKILPLFGFRACAKAWQAARPLRPIRQAFTHQAKNWKLAPRFLRNFLWSQYPRLDLDQPWAVRRIVADESISTADQFSSPRSKSFFEYLQRCPTADFTLWQILDRQTPVGFFSLAIVRGQARIAGIWLHNATEAGWQTAYTLAQRTARSVSGSPVEIVARGTEGITATAALKAGLRIQSRVPVFLLNASGKWVLPDNFQFQLADDDATFLDSGSHNYLT